MSTTSINFNICITGVLGHTTNCAMVAVALLGFLWDWGTMLQNKRTKLQLQVLKSTCFSLQIPYLHLVNVPWYRYQLPLYLHVPSMKQSWNWSKLFKEIEVEPGATWWLLYPPRIRSCPRFHVRFMFSE